MWPSLTRTSIAPFRWLGMPALRLEELGEMLAGYRNGSESVAQAQRLHDEWEAEVQRNYDTLTAESGLPYQGALSAR